MHSLQNLLWSWTIDNDAFDEPVGIIFRDNRSRILYAVCFAEGQVALDWCFRSREGFFERHARAQNVIHEVKQTERLAA